ncbi:MAG: sodium-dependent transporter [Paramuribaculum sp.]|nr:sodium-dependent transporter [Paramuribaculum sp.]
MKEQNQRAVFVTRLGAVAATVGSAVGLGNIWRFPYEAGTHGGGAFMVCYIAFIFILGVPVICAEFMLGRGTRRNVFGAYRAAGGGNWKLAGYIGIIASLMILSFYSVVAGWTVEYFTQSITGALDFADQDSYHKHFDEFSTGTWRPVAYTLIFLLLNYLVLSRGVTKGIERVSNVLMPLLFVLLIVFCVNSLSLPKAIEGLTFLFRPDFSALDPSTLLGALGQAFFSLSLGLGCMLTYGSYFNERTNIGRTALVTASLDTMVAILAGVIIFPAVFTFGVSPAAGPTLVFEVLPSIFHNLPGGVMWSSLFFFLLFVASLTSTISMSEISIAYFTEQRGMSRRNATVLNTAIAMVFGTLCALSFGSLSGHTIFGMTIFNLFDYVSSNILLPLGGIVISLFVSWKVDRNFVKREMTSNGLYRCSYLPVLIFCLRYVCPTAIALIMLNSLGII